MQMQADFFISFSSYDKIWGIDTWTLDQEGYSIIYQPWNFKPGTNFIIAMDNAVSSKKTIAILSNNYLQSKYAKSEWAAVFAQDPIGINRKLVPIRIEECSLTGTLLAQIVYIDLLGVFDQELARKKLIEGLKDIKPSEKPEYPSTSSTSPLFPGTILDSVKRQSKKYNNYLLPPVGIRIPPSTKFTPPLFRGIKVNRDNPLVLDFILDSCGAVFDIIDLEEIASRLTKYFLSSLTIPDSNLWVNLSPYEENKIIPDDLGKTQMGIDLLGQDYVLKQMTSSFLYPEMKIGNSYWKEIYRVFGNNIDTEAINTFNKIWIIPDAATIVEKENFAIIEKHLLNVLTEKDYFIAKIEEHKDRINSEKDLSIGKNNNAHIATQIFRSLVLPEIYNEVNDGGNFAVLRQIYNCLLLAMWYKDVLQRSITTDLRINREGKIEDNNLSPIEIYNQYLELYKVGIFDYIREEFTNSENPEVVPRRYFSGGITAIEALDLSQRVKKESLVLKSNSTLRTGSLFCVRVNLRQEDGNMVYKNITSVEKLGGIDLGLKHNFDFRIEKENNGIEFNLSGSAISNLEKNGIGQLKPKIIFIKAIKGNLLEISKKRKLEEQLENISNDLKLMGNN